MRFTDGLWKDRDGYRLHRAHELWEYEIKDDCVKAMVPCCEIRTLRDTIHGPALHFVFRAPAPDMISVEITHYSGRVKRGPEFTLNRQDTEFEVTDSEDEIRIKNGRMTVVVGKKGMFSYKFFFDGKLLTMSENQSAAYVTDVDYEADKWRDFNGRTPGNYNKHTYIREMLNLSVGELIYGFGEQFTAMVKNGQSVDIWNRDGGSNGNQAYKNIPFYLSSQNYGLLVNTPDRVQFEVASISSRHVDFSVEGESMEYIVIGGEDPKDIISRYTALIGRSPVPPADTFGLWLSTSWMPDSDVKITMDTIKKMEEYKIPLSVFHFDARWMDDYKCCNFRWSDRYGDAQKMLKEIHDHGVKVCVWINSYVSQESELFEEGRDKGYFIKDKEGNVWQSDEWMTGIGVVDFTNPEATKWYQEKLGRIIDMGVDYVKTDFGERLPVDVVYYDGSDPRKMHNYYPYLYNKAIYDLLEEKHGKGSACVFSRSATVGTQQFPVNWGGDNESSYISMAETLRGGLSFSQSGYGFWAHDISGFVGTATPDLYNRWVAFGLLSSHSRLHGEESYRAPWYFGEECCEVLKFFTDLKCSLMPYLYAQANKVHTEGIPMMRSMMMEFPGEPSCGYLDRQYMFGDNLLVAPVFSEDSTVTFYVPGSGLWTSYLDGEKFQGGKWYTRTYGYKDLPLLVRPNSIIVEGKAEGQIVYDYGKNVTLKVYEMEEGVPASCEVFDAGCERVLKAAVEKKEGTVTIETEASDESWSVCLMGIYEAAEILGGSMEKTEDGLMIRPDGSEKITVKL